MDVNIKGRDGENIDTCINSESSLGFLYGTLAGRLILKLLTRPFVSRLGSLYMNSSFSKRMIESTVQKANIDMSQYEKKNFSSYNDFFTRRIKSEYRPISQSENVFIAPCDAKLSAYKISDKSIFFIKNSAYTVTDLLGGNKTLAESYKGGYCLIFRLTVDDYHRYCYIDEGTKGENTFVKGILHTVNPIALERYNIYKRNCREYTVLKTKNFGDVTQIEVGAMMVGRIKNLHGAHSFRRGEEKGMFEFGGSTIVLLVKADTIFIDRDIIKNTSKNIETVVRLGERIGEKVQRNYH